MNRFMRYLSIYLFDKSARFNAAILLGIVVNSLYVIVNLVMGILQESVWQITVAAYYLLIIILRYLIIEDEDTSEASALIVSRLLLIISAPMLGMIIYAVLIGESVSRPRMALPYFAVYAAVCIVRVVFGYLIPSWDSKSLRGVLRAMRLSIALMSIFNFQLSLLSVISVTKAVRLLLNFITGGAVALSIFALAAKINGKKDFDR